MGLGIFIHLSLCNKNENILMTKFRQNYTYIVFSLWSCILSYFILFHFHIVVIPLTKLDDMANITVLV
jgi:hypothetical protein